MPQGEIGYFEDIWSKCLPRNRLMLEVTSLLQSIYFLFLKGNTFLDDSSIETFPLPHNN